MLDRATTESTVDLCKVKGDAGDFNEIDETRGKQVEMGLKRSQVIALAERYWVLNDSNH